MINDDELLRFYTASGGQFSTFLASVQKTIRWRQTNFLLLPQELEHWSDFVYWHGRDGKQQPCLIIRLGLAFSQLTSNKKAGFAQAVVSQVEYGVLHLLDAKITQFTVLMDCEELSHPYPIEIMKSVAVLLLYHYPSRLGYLYILRLPLILRVVIQTLTQVMNPPDSEKWRFLGRDYHKVLSENLQTLPSFLGGQCTCPKCSIMVQDQNTNEEEIVVADVQRMYDQVLQTIFKAFIGFLMVSIFSVALYHYYQ